MMWSNDFITIYEWFTVDVNLFSTANSAALFFSLSIINIESKNIMF